MSVLFPKFWGTQRKPQWAVFAETGTLRVRFAYSYLGLKWLQFVVGLRSWIDRKPSCVYSLGLGDLPDAEDWITMLRERPEEVRAALNNTRKEMHASWRGK